MAEIPPYEAIGGDGAGLRIEDALRADYATAQANFRGFGAWMFRVCYDTMTLGSAAAIAKHQTVWRAELERANGKPIPWPPPVVRPFPEPPTREQLLNGRTTQQGLRVTTAQFGEMPWWGACWAWLTPDDRARAAAQLLAAGDTVCVIQLPDGLALYDEPQQFYSRDKFGPLDMTPLALVALIDEAMTLGFVGVWLFLGGDDGSKDGYDIAVRQVRELAPLLGGLNRYVVYMPGWDGVFYGYTPQQVAGFAREARGAGALYVGLEHSTGHIPVGNGPADYAPDGLMAGYDLVLGEFDDDRFDGSVWEVLARMLGPAYVRPAEQPPDDDPHPPHYLARSNTVYRVFEFDIYRSVRGMEPTDIRANRAKFEAMGAVNVC